MICNQIKQYIYGEPYIIDIYSDNSCGTFLDNGNYITETNLTLLIDTLKSFN